MEIQNHDQGRVNSWVESERKPDASVFHQEGLERSRSRQVQL